MRLSLSGLTALLLLLLAGCTAHPVAVKRAFYFWRSDYIRDEESDSAKSLHAHKLYLKMFEVERHPVMGPVPADKSSVGSYSVPMFADSQHRAQELVPTVYVNDNVFTGLSPAGIDSLAENIGFLVKKRLEEGHWRAYHWTIQELQIDCDWTAAHKVSYFRLLEQLKKTWGGPISCTLRLYPFKYRERMGTPPVDRAMLMCYNLLNPMAHAERNTILDTEELEGYLTRQRRYPVPLDIALPLYSRMQWHQNGHFVKTLETEALDTPLLRATRPFWYEVTADTTIGTAYLRRGDAIKLEQVSVAELESAARMLHRRLELQGTVTVALFHLDESLLKHYGHDTLDRIYTAFTR